ncbi:MAG: hypothetical protein M1828_005320 [Chrysothrix sp. TS-e1954]|nr:MAG: hypothetical protein M1828_005320 [Chrysothrix sp. TS-e1954]
MESGLSSSSGRPPRPPSHRKPVGANGRVGNSNPSDRSLAQEASSPARMSPARFTSGQEADSDRFGQSIDVYARTPIPSPPSQIGLLYSDEPQHYLQTSSGSSHDTYHPSFNSQAFPIRAREARSDPVEPQPYDVPPGGFRFPFNEPRPTTPTIHVDGLDTSHSSEPQEQPQLQYFHHSGDSDDLRHPSQRNSMGTARTSLSSESDRQHWRSPDTGHSAAQSYSRPASGHALGPNVHARGRSLTPQDTRRDQSSSSGVNNRNLSASSDRSGDLRPSSSYADLLNIPHAQQMAHQLRAAGNARAQTPGGSNVAVMDSEKTLELYRANVGKINELRPQYEFALLLINAAQRSPIAEDELKRKKHIKEARSILQKLSEKSYPFAQYYLADGYASGLFSDGEPDNQKAFPLFIAAGKRGHAEAAYRAGICYEFGWGSKKDLPKAAQYYLQAAKNNNHPGAALRLGKAYIEGGMGLKIRQREGVTLLKIAEKYADTQHNAGPYELGCLHEIGFDAGDAWKDDPYVVQLFTKSAELGHPEANFRLGGIYEKGLLGCPVDSALSIHYYNTAAEAGIPAAMMVLSASFFVGVRPVLDQDSEQAYMWALKAAETDLPMALYTVAWCKENGIGCNRDPLDANVWYRKAADEGEERAIQRLKKIMGDSQGRKETSPSRLKIANKLVSKKKSGIFSSFEQREDGEPSWNLPSPPLPSPASERLTEETHRVRPSEKTETTSEDVEPSDHTHPLKQTYDSPLPPPQGVHRQSDRIDTFASYDHSSDCGISSLDLHLPFEPLCPDRASVLEAMSTGGRPGYDRFYITSGCDMRWYSSQEISDILSRFSHIFILGDSMMRHLTNALYILLRGDMAYGGITDWDVPAIANTSINGREDCACEMQFASHDCSNLVIKDYQWLLGNSSEDLRFELPEDFDMTYHVLNTWPLGEEDLDDVTDSVYDLSGPPPRPYAFLLHHTLWNDVNTSATLEWLNQVQDHLKDDMPWLGEDDQAFPRLFMTTNAGGLSKSLFHMATQDNSHLARFEGDIKPQIEEMGIDFLGMFNMSVQSSQPDGTHASFETNLLKAQMVLNWLDHLELT